jgi:hypothetical protein
MAVDRPMSRTHALRPGTPARQATGLRRWRESKVRPIPGNSPHDRLVGRGMACSLKESLRRSLPRHRIPHQLRMILGAQYAFSKAWRNLSGPMGFNFKNQSQNQILGRDHTASRWSAPSPGKRTRREEHALSHRPQMSSGRLFLDQVGRHQSPSPLRRHAQTTTPFPRGGPKPELSTLLGRGTFYFALTAALTTPARTKPREPGARERPPLDWLTVAAWGQGIGVRIDIEASSFSGSVATRSEGSGNSPGRVGYAVWPLISPHQASRGFGDK